MFKGDDKDVFLDRREFTGSVTELIEKGLEYILAKINMGCYFKGAYRHDRYELPPDEMRELVVNAFAHRSYLQHNAPVFIAIYDDRIEITSPGGLPRGQTAERALAGYSKIRNDVLARALNYMRFIEEWGSGLRRVNKVFSEYGIRDITLEDSGFAVRTNVYRSVSKAGNEPVNPDSSTKNGGDEPLNEPLKRKNTLKKGNDEPLNEPLNEPLKAIYTTICENPGIQAPSIVNIVGKSLTTVKRAISRLKTLEKIEFRGSLKTGGYYSIDKL